MTQKIPTPIAIGIIIILALAVGAGVWWYGEKDNKLNDVNSNISNIQCGYNNTKKEYKYRDEDTCERAFIVCNEGEKIFNNECGCGCEIINVVDTSDWQTYRNEKYGFEVKYPASLFKIKIDSGEKFLNIYIEELNIREVDTEGLSSGVYIFLEDVKNKNIKTLYDLMQDIKSQTIFDESLTVGDIITDLQKTTFAGYEAYKFIEGIGVSDVYRIVLLKSGLSFNLEYSSTGTNFKERGDIHNQILSTFKFIE